jgi:hypothetical protein
MQYTLTATTVYHHALFLLLYPALKIVSTKLWHRFPGKVLQ